MLGVIGLEMKQTSKMSVGRDTETKQSLNFDFYVWDRLVGIVVKASDSKAEDPGLESRLRRDFSGIESYQ